MATSTAARRRRRTAKEVERAAVITDGCNPELVEGARFDGILEIPVIERPEKLVIPSAMVPFSKRGRVDRRGFAVCEYEDDRDFADLMRHPKDYAAELRRYQAFVTPDASLFWDAPLAAQVVNKYRNHAIGAYMQRHGVYVIPNVRWGDERTYTTDFLPEPLAFLGVERRSIVSIGTFGQVKTRHERRHMRAGLAAMLAWLEPEVVLVYGAMPKEIFGEFEGAAEFVRYPDWTTYIKEVTPDRPKAGEGAAEGEAPVGANAATGGGAARG